MWRRGRGKVPNVDMIDRRAGRSEAPIRTPGSTVPGRRDAFLRLHPVLSVYLLAVHLYPSCRTCARMAVGIFKAILPAF